MARIHQDSFEFNTTTANPAGYDTVTNLVVGTTNARTGTYAAQITSLASGVARGANKKFQTAAATNNFLRVYLYIVTYPSADNQIINFSNTVALGSGQRCSISLSSTGTLKLLNNTPAQIGSASSALSLNTWYRVELRCDTTNASGSRTAAASLDGTIFATSSTETLGGTASSFSIGGNLALEAQTTGEWWFDDIALNDNTGSFQTSYPGSGKVLQLYPNAAGDANGYLVQVGGTAGSSNNFTRVNEIPPNDATSYNASAVLNAEDLFNVTDSGMGASDTVNVVAVGGRFADITGADATSGIKLEIIKTSGGTKSQSANIVPNSTGWNSLGPSSPRLYPIILYQDPDGSSWTQTTVDSMQIGYTLDAVAVQAVGITNLWASVDYTPSSAVNASVTQIAATVTATGGTQTIATVQNSSVTQSAANVTASGGTQVVTSVQMVQITQVAGSVTATGGTQTVTSVRIASVTQVAANVTATGGTQTIATIRSVQITQPTATVTTTGGTQTLTTTASVSIAQSGASVILTGGIQAITAVTVLNNQISSITVDTDGGPISVDTGGNSSIVDTDAAPISVDTPRASIAVDSGNNSVILK